MKSCIKVHGLGAQHTEQWGWGEMRSKHLQFRVLFHFNCFSFGGQIKGQAAISYIPREGYEEKEVFFLQLPNMYLLLPSNFLFVPVLFLHSLFFFSLPGRVGFPLYLSSSFICWSLQWHHPRGTRIVIYVSSAINIASSGDTTGTAVS